MFKIKPDPTFTEPVVIPPGQGKDATIQVEFKHLEGPALESFYAGLKDVDNDATALSEIIVGWRGIDAEYSEANLGVLLSSYPGAATALFEAYRAALLGARRKN